MFVECLRMRRGAAVALVWSLGLGLFHAGDAGAVLSVDVGGSMGFISDLTSGGESLYVRAAGRSWQGFDFDIDGFPDGLEDWVISPEGGSVGVHLRYSAAADEVVSSVFRPEFGAGVVDGPVRLLPKGGGDPIRPAAVYSAGLDSGRELLGAGHVIVEDAMDGSREVVRVVPTRPITIDPMVPQNIWMDFHLESGVQRTASVTVGPGEVATDFIALPDGRVVGGVATPGEVSLFDFGDPTEGVGGLTPVGIGVVGADSGIEPLSYVLQRNESNFEFLSVQDGNTLRSFTHDGVSLVPGPTQAIPAGASGKMFEHFADWNHVYVYFQGGALHAGHVGQPVHAKIQLGDVNETLDAGTAAGSATAFQSLDGDASLIVMPGGTPYFGGGWDVLRAHGHAEVVDYDLSQPIGVTGRGANAVRLVGEGGQVQADTAARGRLATGWVMRDPGVDPATRGWFLPDVDDEVVVHSRIAAVNPGAADLIAGLRGEGLGGVDVLAMAVMDTSLVGAGETRGVDAVGIIYQDPSVPFDLAATKGIRSQVVAHGDGSQGLAVSVGASDPGTGGSGETGGALLDELVPVLDQVFEANAVSESSYVVVTNNLLVPAVQKFKDDAGAAVGGEVDVLAFEDLLLETTTSVTASVSVHVPGLGGGTGGGLSGVGGDLAMDGGLPVWVWDESVTGSTTGLLSVSLVLEGEGGSVTLLEMSGTPFEVSEKIRSCTTLPTGCPAAPPPPFVPTPFPVVAKLSYELTSVDGSVVFFDNHSGLVMVPEPGGIGVWLLSAGVGLVWRGRYGLRCA